MSFSQIITSVDVSVSRHVSVLYRFRNLFMFYLL
jgi:hypothetical protein